MMKNFLFILLILSWSWASAQDADCSFGLVLNSTSATVGEMVSIDVTTRHFNDIAAMQYSHQWNPNQLQFEGVIYSNDSPLTESAFNLSAEDTDAGFLRLAFIDNTLQGVHLIDNTVLYSLSFTYLQPGEAQVKTNGEELAIEIVNSTPETINDYYFIHAIVTDQASLLPSLNTACIIGESCGGAASASININVNEAESLSFQWGNNAGFSSVDEDINGLSAASYSFTATHQDGLHLYGDFYVSQANGLSIQLAVDNDECGGDADGAITATVLGGSGNYTYAWSNGETTASINNLEGGTYTVTVTDNDLGCSGSKEAQVENNSTFWLSSQTIDASCNNAADGSIDISVDAPASYAPFTYEWSNGSTTEDISNLEAGPYIVNITASNGCSIEYGVFIFHEDISISGTVINGSCQSGEGGSISLDIDTNDYTILWSNDATTATVTDLAAGDYSVTVTQIETSCTAEETFTVLSGDMVIGYSTQCNDGNIQLQVAIWNNDDAPYTFEWSTGDVTTNDMISTIFVNSDGTYAVTITSASGCIQVADGLDANCSNSTIDLSLSPQNLNVNNGSSFCLDIKAEEFIDQLAFQFSLEWDETLLDFTEVTNFGFSNMNNSDFGIALADDGFLSVAWLTSDLINGESLAANSTLFSICFDAIATTETSTLVQLSNIPTPLEFVGLGNIIETVNTQNAQIDLNGGGSGNGDLELTIEDETAYQGELVCVPVVSSGFSDLVGLQFSMAWDTDGLEFNSIQNINVPQVSFLTNFSSIEEAQSDGTLRFLWQDNNVSGEYLQQGVPLFEVCFIATGEAGNYPVNFSETPLPSQAINSNIEEVEIILNNGNIEILGPIGDEPISLGIASGGVSPGASICLPVYAIEFEQLTAMQFSINWDQALITIDNIEILDNLPGLNTSNFNVSESEGTIAFSWISPSLETVSLDENTPLFELCFTANQMEGVAAVTFSNQPTPFEFVRGTDVIGFTPVNGQIVVSTEGLVWPGDTDTNTEVNHFDLLNIGLAFGAEGAARNNASIIWIAQHAGAWIGETPNSNINYRHMDTDGNGIVNEADVIALEQNWGETTDGFVGSTGEGRELEIVAVPFYVQPDTVQAGAQVSLPIMLGTEDTAVEDAYGIAFSILYDPMLVRPGSAHIVFDGWMGNQAEGILGVYKDDHGWGRIDIALVRTDGQNVSGHGQIASFGIIMEDVIFRDLVDAELLVRIENVRLINIQEEELPTTPRESIILVENLTNNREAFELRALKIHPNPTVGSFTISHPNIDIQNIHIFDSKGQLNISLDKNNTTISQLPAGVYWLQFLTDKGIAYRKMVKL